MRKIILLICIAIIFVFLILFTQNQTEYSSNVTQDIERPLIFLTTQNGSIILNDTAGKQQFQVWLEAKYIGARKKKILITNWKYNPSLQQLTSEVTLSKIPWYIVIQLKEQQIQIKATALDVENELISFERIIIQWEMVS